MTRTPLSWLQAFEAAGRLGSFKAAAAELNVSPSNVSHQIRDLESHLGVLLFSRTGRSIALTVEGARFLPDLSAGFRSIRSASPHAEAAATRLHIGAFPFLANEILTPRLGELRALLPELEIRLFTHNDTRALTHVEPGNRLDVAICYGSGKFPGLAHSELADIHLVPTSGPDADVSSVDQLMQQPLVRVVGPFQGWQLWQAQHQPTMPQLDFHLETDSYHAAMLAVARNEGICLAVQPFVNGWITDGRVKAYPQWQITVPGQSAHAVYAPFQQHNPHIERFTAWLADHLK